ncbi:MAG: NAD(P)-dependent glycerol-3-phosphate dehydrogenase [Alphaproteobacteria bacterium]|nr:NAD(P)-dependent glycerol-3-phosphate dehydrogenase [Alphaproteobacteria bacterium]
MSAIETIGVVGAGAWGTALAINAARAGRNVVLWGRDADAARAMSESRENDRYLPGIALPPAIRITDDLAAASAADAILLVVPAQTVGEIAGVLSPGGQPLAVCAKGLERSTDQRLSEIVREAAPGRPIATLSGPNFAREVALGLPAAATLACPDETLGQALAASMSHEKFRLYWTDDLIGVEIGGAIKNVLAIAAGMVAGKGLGENAKAALITRGLAELTRLGEALGARRDTLIGLSGLGDLLLTAGSPTSRNMAFGMKIGEGADPVRLQQEPGALVEGVATAAAVIRLAQSPAGGRCPLPICEAVAAILAGKLDVDRAMEALMTRPLRAEADEQSA